MCHGLVILQHIFPHDAADFKLGPFRAERPSREAMLEKFTPEKRTLSTSQGFTLALTDIIVPFS